MGLLDICRVILNFTKSGVSDRPPKWIFRFLRVVLQGLFATLTGAFWAWICVTSG